MIPLCNGSNIPAFSVFYFIYLARRKTVAAWKIALESNGEFSMDSRRIKEHDLSQEHLIDTHFMHFAIQTKLWRLVAKMRRAGGRRPVIGTSWKSCFSGKLIARLKTRCNIKKLSCSPWIKFRHSASSLKGVRELEWLEVDAKHHRGWHSSIISWCFIILLEITL